MSVKVSGFVLTCSSCSLRLIKQYRKYRISSVECHLTAPEKIYNIEIQIIQHLDIGWWLVKKYLGPSCKGFDISSVFRQERNDFFCQAVFPTDVWEWSNHKECAFNKESVARFAPRGPTPRHRESDLDLCRYLIPARWNEALLANRAAI